MMEDRVPSYYDLPSSIFDLLEIGSRIDDGGSMMALGFSCDLPSSILDLASF
jgi:hypothetical protein